MARLLSFVRWLLAKARAIANKPLRLWHQAMLWLLSKARPIAAVADRFLVPLRPWRPAILWVLIALAAICAVVLNDVGAILGKLEGGGANSFDPSAFTGFRFPPTDTEQLGDALAHWKGIAADQAASRASGESPVSITRLLTWHFGTDLLFVPAYCAIMAALLWFVRVPRRFWLTAVATILVLDWAETLVTWFVIRDLDGGRAWLMAIQFLAFAKWIAIAGTLVPLVVWSFNSSAGGFSLRDAFRRIAIARAGGREHPAVALFPITLLVTLFAAFVALPAGGALDQVPDVLRYQVMRLDDGWGGDWNGARLVAFSSLALLVLTGAVMIGGLAATAPAKRPPHLGNWVFSVAIVLVMCALSGVFLLLARAFDGRWAWSTLSYAGVALILTAIAFIAAQAKVGSAPPQRRGARPPRRWSSQELGWVGSLAAIVLIAGGIGLVRAAFPAFVTGFEDDPLPWWFVGASGAAVALAAAALVPPSLVLVARLRIGQKLRMVASKLGAGIIIGLVIAAAQLLLREPSEADQFGLTGVIALGLALAILLIGGLSWLSHRTPSWQVTQKLGFGLRTPWLLIVIVIWAAAGLIDTEGGYHDVRTVERAPATARYTSLDEAFGEWLMVQCPTADGTVPLVLVAAPGGGIKAAYWTEGALQQLFGSDDCARRGLFAISGVSGGAVGSTTWVAATASQESSHDAIDGLANDEALSAVVAGLLLRDLQQPLTGITTAWRDRSALLEDEWIAAADDVFEDDFNEPLPWDEVGVGPGMTWRPVLVANASSVNDGCRVLLSNTATLPTAPEGDCYSASFADSPPAGPISGAIDPLAGLSSRSASDKKCSADETSTTGSTLRATTAASLSARYPVVSSTGTVFYCASGQTGGRQVTTYVVDGGYYENSGLLTILQMWSALEPRVRFQCTDNDSTTLCVEPWIVLLDSGYRSSVESTSAARPRELPAIFAARGRGREIISSRALEQAAAWQTAIASERCVEDLNAAGSTDPPPRPELDQVDPTCTGFVRVGLTVRPEVAAPLGWVLSEASRRNLDKQLEELFLCPAGDLALLLEDLGAPDPTCRDESPLTPS